MSTIKTTRRLVESAVMIALAVALSAIPLPKMPYGGSITVFSQVPIVLIAYRYGTPWGLFTGVVMGVGQMILGAGDFSYVSGIPAILAVAFLDYLGAFAFLGLGGVFKNRLHRPALEIALGAFTGSALRFLCHAVSGATIWKGYANGQSVLRYTIAYNGFYMVPETILTIIGAVGVAMMFDLSSPNLKTRARKPK